ncbi:HEAT repeat domain-containing protein [bacterium]|nr:HEAT repeat domain-containing protein [bacterium]
MSAFLREQRWYYDLARAHDGSFPYQGGAGMSGGEHKYGKWDCTGAFVLANTFHKQELFITGRGVNKKNRLVGDELTDTIEAGRGFNSWSKGSEHYAEKRPAELMRDLKSWSPAVRSRAAKALASSGDTPTAELRVMLKSRRLDVRYGACQAISELGAKAAAALPELRRCLQSDDVWLRIQAAYALSALGNRARKAIPDMLELALLEEDEDPREITQRYLAFCLFYPGGALGMRGLLSKNLGDVDRSDLLPVIERLLLNDDGRARGAMGTIFKLMTLEELKPLLPQLVEAVRTPSPSGVMFSNGVRLAGLDFLAANRIAEGMELCILVTEIDKWGKQDRILRCMKALQQYGGAARPVLPQLRDLKKRLRAHREARNLEKQIQACVDTIDAIESAGASPEVRTVAELTGSRRSRR